MVEANECPWCVRGMVNDSHQTADFWIPPRPVPCSTCGGTGKRVVVAEPETGDES